MMRIIGKRSLSIAVDSASSLKDMQSSTSVRILGSLFPVQYNRYNLSEVESIGPNRACAEWVLGGKSNETFIQFKHWKTSIANINHLPPEPIPGLFPIESISFNNNLVNFLGLQHLDGLQSLQELKFIDCPHVCNKALAKLSFVRTCLHFLEICGNDEIDEIGLSYLTILRELETLKLSRLRRVKRRKEMLKFINDELPRTRLIHDFE